MRVAVQTPCAGQGDLFGIAAVRGDNYALGADAVTEVQVFACRGLAGRNLAAGRSLTDQARMAASDGADINVVDQLVRFARCGGAGLNQLKRLLEEAMAPHLAIACTHWAEAFHEPLLHAMLKRLFAHPCSPDIS